MRAVLMLHGVDDTGSVLSISPAELRSLLSAIRASGHRIVPLAELLADSSEPDTIALTFDDGFRSVAEHAAPILAEQGATAALFLTTGHVGRDNRWPSQPEAAPHFELMSWPEVEQLHAAGWAIEGHSVSHPDLRRSSDAELERELCEPIETIERRLGRRPRSLAYPYGHFDARVARAAARHYSHALTTVLRPLGANVEPHRVPRIDAYYLRDRAVHGRFGSRALELYLTARGALRSLRAHVAELRA